MRDKKPLRQRAVTTTVGTPHNRDLTPEYVNSLLGLSSHALALGYSNIRLHLFEGSLVHQARNKIAAHCHDDYLLFIDSDMAFPVDGLKKLIDLDKDIAGGLYFMRKVPNNPAVFYKNETGRYRCVEPIPAEPFQCDALATGFMLIKKKVFDRFDQYVKETDHLPFDFLSNDVNGELGEDMAFCHRAKELGFEIWCDPTIEIGHVATEVITRNNYEAYKALRENDVQE